MSRFLQPIRIQMQYMGEPDGRNGLPRHSNPFTDLFRSTGSDRGHLYQTESNGLYIYSENWKLKKLVPIDGIITLITRQQRDIWLGLDETGIFFNKNKQTFTWLHKDNTNLNNTRYAHSFPTATVPFWSEHSGD